MQNAIEQLEQLARDIRMQDEELAVEVREAGREAQEHFERVIRAIHRTHHFLLLLPNKLADIIHDLEK